MSGEAAPSAGQRFAVIIPARYQSTRYPGKPLAPLRGATGQAKSLIQRSWECAMAIPGAIGVWVATDDERIAHHVEEFGGKVVMTGSTLRNGTERCAEAAARLGLDLDVVINLQGDAPLTPVPIVEALVKALADDPGAAMATPGVACSASLYRHLVEDQRGGRVGGTTVVANGTGHALYFSKQIIPHIPPALDATGHEQVRLHLGLYAYRPAALQAYVASEPSRLELLEGLEQLRFLETDAKIRVVPVDPPDWDCIELNNPEDVPAIEAALAARNLA